MPTNAEIKQWLDKQIEMNEEDIRFECLCEGIERCGVNHIKRIHIYTGIFKMAEILECEVKKEDDLFDDGEFTYSFEYRGYEFFQLGEDRKDD